MTSQLAAAAVMRVRESMVSLLADDSGSVLLLNSICV